MTQEATDTRNIYQRMHAVMEAVDYIQKERKTGMRYTIVSHDAVTAKVRPVLVANRVVYYPAEMTCSQVGNRTQIEATIRFVNIDNPSDFMDVKSCGYGIDDQDKGPGKGISYSVKYALLKALGLETGDDPDEESIPHKVDPPKEEKAETAATMPATKADEVAKASITAALDLCETAAEVKGVMVKNKAVLDRLPDGEAIRKRARTMFDKMSQEEVAA